MITRKGIERFIMVILTPIMSFLLGVLLTGWLLTKRTPAIYEGLLIIIFPAMLIYYVYKQMEDTKE